MFVTFKKNELLNISWSPFENRKQTICLEMDLKWRLEIVIKKIKNSLILKFCFYYNLLNNMQDSLQTFFTDCLVYAQGLVPH